MDYYIDEQFFRVNKKTGLAFIGSIIFSTVKKIDERIPSKNILDVHKGKYITHEDINKIVEVDDTLVVLSGSKSKSQDYKEVIKNIKCRKVLCIPQTFNVDDEFKELFEDINEF